MLQKSHEIQVRGRFAPSPTGPLHLGSLVAAIGSYLDARSRGGQWLVRIEDVDRPRTAPGAADAILRTLEACALLWDGEVLYQTSRTEAYREALNQLKQKGDVYPCCCTRRELGETWYPGTCRDGMRVERESPAWRLRVHSNPVQFTDRAFGAFEERLDETVGDFVLRRADGLYSYQLAVVVDDAFQQITDIVRGADLLDSTARQIYLQELLGYPRPSYLHLPLVVDASGQKLSKQTKAAPVPSDPGPSVFRAFEILRQRPPDAMRQERTAHLINWGIRNWRPENLRAFVEPVGGPE